MHRSRGHMVSTDLDGKQTVHETFTCPHCNAVVAVRQGQAAADMGGFCRLCYGHICGPCSDDGRCVPFERRIAELEQRDRLRRSIG